MTNNSSSSTANVAGVALMAGLVGAAVGLLLAPKSGTETIEDLRMKMERAKLRSRERANELRLKAQENASKALEKVDQTADKIQVKTKETTDNAKDVAHIARDQIDDAASQAAAEDRTRRNLRR